MNKTELAFYAMSNMVAAAGFVFVAVVVVPRLGLRSWTTRLGTMGFLLAVAVARVVAAQAALTGSSESFFQMGLVFVMAICVWSSIFGLYREMVLGFTKLSEITDLKEIREVALGLEQATLKVEQNTVVLRKQFDEYMEERHQRLADAVQAIWGLSEHTTLVLEDTNRILREHFIQLPGEGVE